jgi:hypothetical protein
MSYAEKVVTTEHLLQEELQDLRTLSIHSDHLRWVTCGRDIEKFDAIVSQFAAEWRGWGDELAHCLIRHGYPPDARVSALTNGSHRGWLSADWLDISDAGKWIARELDVLSSWSHWRREEAEEDEVKTLFAQIEKGLVAELYSFTVWQNRISQRLDIVEEVGLESFPASDSPSWWSGSQTS